MSPVPTPRANGTCTSCHNNSSVDNMMPIYGVWWGGGGETRYKHLILVVMVGWLMVVTDVAKYHTYCTVEYSTGTSTGNLRKIRVNCRLDNKNAGKFPRRGFEFETYSFTRFRWHFY
jgi:hypothetical protein